MNDIISNKLLLGQQTDHLDRLNESTLLHFEIIEPLKKLQYSAIEKGFDLQVISGFRSFEKQLHIWNAKALGQRKILDDAGFELDYKNLNKEELLFAILRFSAIPGASRHHWGTDFDIYDANSIKKEDVQLVESECVGDGACANMHQWLSERIEKNKSFDFYRPYKNDLGGVAPEPWHLSYKPLSDLYTKSFSYDLFVNHIKNIEIELKDLILKNSKDIYNNYIINIC